MRRLLVVLCSLALTSAAAADDFDVPILRGSNPFVPAAPVYTNWSGFYVGGQTGYGSAHADFSGATKSLFALMFQQLSFENPANVSPVPSTWPVLGKADSQAPTFGGYFGYNSQWDNVIIGADFNFNRSKFSSDAVSSNPPLRRVVAAGGNAYDITVSGNASMKIDDFATARGRVGYVMGTFLPYATLGVAVGKTDVTRTANAFIVQNPPSPYDLSVCGAAAAPTCAILSQTTSEAKNNAFIWGWAVGGGFDVLLLQNFFLRAEYEYVNFGSLAGTKASINSGRVGLGYKF